VKISQNTGSTYEQGDGKTGGTREPPIAVRKGCSGSTEGGCRVQGVGADEARVRLTEGAGDGLHAAVDGEVVGWLAAHESR